MVVPAEFVEDSINNMEYLELVSPTSINEVIELKECMSTIESQMNWEFISQPKDRSSEKFVCVTDCSGNIKYTNFMKISKSDNIIGALEISCKTISSLISEITKNNVTANKEIETILHGHICLITINRLKTPVILKLQLATDTDKDGENLLIWMFKKASIVPAALDDVDRFKIDEESDDYFKFSKLNLVLAIDQNELIANSPQDFFRYILGENFISNPRHLDDLIEVTEEMSHIFEEHVSTEYIRKFSSSSLDLSVEDCTSFKSIFTTKSVLKNRSRTPISVNIFDAFNSHSKGILFPVQIKYEVPDECILPQPNLDFQGFKLLRNLSESDHSSVYEGMRLFQPDSRVIIKLLNHQANYTCSHPEVKFYKFYTSSPNQCEYIEQPFKIDEAPPRNVIYMNSISNRIDLFEFIRSNPPLPDASVKTIFTQIAKAIEYLHDNRIVHRDIKSENVLIDTSSLKVTLIDFGSALFLEDGVPEGDHYAGTIAYAPIEVLKGHPFNGPEQDIWCLGVVLYMLCFKELPFRSPKEILQGILRLPIERPEACIQLLRRMIEPNPKIRPTIKEVLNSEFLL